MPWDILLTAVVSLIAGGLVGHFVGQNPQKAQALLWQAEQTVATEVSKLRGELTSLLSHASAAPSTAAPPPNWSLGTTYASITALSADITSVGFHQQINIDDVPTFNVGGPNPINFYRVGQAVTQIRPGTLTV